MVESNTHINAIVIGAGFAGLSVAIELAKRGAKVVVFESAPDMKRQGDVIQIGANATRLMESWGDVLEDIKNTSTTPDTLSIMSKDGNALLEQKLHKEYDGFPNAYGKRARIQLKLYEYALSLGVEIRLDSSVAGVFETENSAGCSVAGQNFEADVLIAADGVHSKTRKHVTGLGDRPKKSGFAVYRSWFPLDALANDPITADIAKSETALFKIWIAEDTHAILTTNPTLQSATCFLTHKDSSDIEEDCNLPGDVDDMLACAQGWDPLLSHIIRQIPPDVLVDYKLLWRDPVSKWVSDGGRVCLIGDSAHPHLPTAGTGAAQAIEDAATIGVVLGKVKTGMVDIPTALRAYHKLRYERTSLTQRMGWETRHMWHQTDWEAVSRNPDMLRLPQPAWLLGIDATKYAEENFDAVVRYLRDDTPFVSKNVPPGHVHEDWTIETMLAREGRKVDEKFYKTRDYEPSVSNGH